MAGLSLLGNIVFEVRIKTASGNSGDLPRGWLVCIARSTTTAAVVDLYFLSVCVCVSVVYNVVL